MSADLITSLKEASHRPGGKLELLDTVMRMAENVRRTAVKKSPKDLLASRVENLAKDMKIYLKQGHSTVTVNNNETPSTQPSGPAGNSAVQSPSAASDSTGNYLLQMPRNDEVKLLELLKRVQLAQDWKTPVIRFIEQKSDERYFRPFVKTSFIKKLSADNNIKPFQLIEELESKKKLRQRGGRRTRRRERNHKRQSRVTRGR